MFSLNNGNVGAELECANEIWSALLHELHNAIFGSVNGEVFTSKNAGTWMNLGSALTNNNFAGLNLLAIGALNTEALGLRVAPVSCRALG